MTRVQTSLPGGRLLRFLPLKAVSCALKAKVGGDRDDASCLASCDFVIRRIRYAASSEAAA